MSVTVIDYISFYYASVSGVPEPPVVASKFVQIGNEDRHFFVFSPKDFTKYHANIVERFCFDLGLEGRYDPERKRFDISDKAWTILGGGKFALDRSRKTLTLFGDSMAYGKFDRTGLVEIITSVTEFSGYRVDVKE